MITMTTDIRNLCAAIDAGDDSAILPLADALEEAGDVRAAGLRQFASSGRKPSDGWGNGSRSRWYLCNGVSEMHSQKYHAIAAPVYRRVEVGETWARSGHVIAGEYLEWDSRSAAILALAEALLDG